MLGRKPTEETRERQRKNSARYWLGKKRAPFSEETKRKMGLAHTGRVASARTREKMSIAQRGNKYGLGGKGALGYRHSEDAKRRIREYQVLNPNKKFSNTSIEVKMMELLDILGIEYLFQFPVEKYAVPDFYIPSKKLAIFCDGCYWHGCPDHYPTRTEKIEKDNRQSTRLREMGYEVLRFWEHDIKNMTTLHL